MQTDIVNISLGFLEGFALIISPCILPILPIILAGSATGSKRRPFGIIVGFVLLFSLFTFFSRQLVQLTGIDLNLIRHASYALLILLGVVMLSTYLTNKFTIATQHLIQIGSNFSTANNTEGGFISGVLFGGLTAIIWTPCAGPILAAVIVQTVVQHTSLMTFLVLVAFGIGAAVPMLFIALFGRQLLAKFTFVKTHTAIFRKILGLMIILSVVYMIYLEENNTVIEPMPTVLTSDAVATQLQEGLASPYPAPALGGIDAWINSPPLTLESLKGKVVLIDFWTYSCINCMRTLPYINALYAKYRDKGLVIIGVHTPEFEFEKNIDNIKNAVERYGIKYPVAVDSQFVTWQNYQNRYWPAHYLINKDGDVVYTHFGEGGYDITENNVRYLLGIKQAMAPAKADEISSYEPQTPETYLGYARGRNFESPEAAYKDKQSNYTFPSTLSQDAWALQGDWSIAPERIISSQANAAIRIKFHAKHVYMVMGNGNNPPIKVHVLLNGKPVQLGRGKDVKDSNVEVNHDTIYEVLSLEKSQTGVLEVVATAPGLEIYTFTFGN